MLFRFAVLLAIFLGFSSCKSRSNEVPELEAETKYETKAAGKADRAAAAKSAAAARSAGKGLLAIAGGSGASLDDVLGGIGSIGSSGLQAAPVPSSRVIIKTGDLGFEVESYDQTTAKIQSLIQQWGGFVSSSSTEIPYENVKTGTWVVRVPASQFEMAMAELKKLARKLESERVAGRDVTEEYYDLEARLKNKLLEEKQAQDILRRSGTISELLSVQRELSRIREEIERFEGRKRYMDDQISLSTITVNLHEAYPVAISPSGGFWATIGNGFSEGFRGFAKVLSGTITFLIAGIPVFAVIGGVIWLIVHFVRKALARRKTTKAEGSAQA